MSLRNEDIAQATEEGGKYVRQRRRFELIDEPSLSRRVQPLRRANFMRRRSFRCLCFRIFFLRFLTTLDIPEAPLYPVRR